LKLKNSFLFKELKLENSLIPIAVVCILAYIAKLSYGLVMGGSTDDFFLVSQQFQFEYPFYMSQGRWVVVFISKILAPLELDWVGGKNVFGIFYAVQIAFSMLILMRALDIKTGKYMEITILAIATLHPYLAEIFTYRHATMINSLCLSYPAMTIGYILLFNKRYRWIGVPLIIWALSGYQVVLSMVLVFIPIQFLNEVIQGKKVKATIQKMVIPVAMLLGSLIIYILLNRLLLSLTGTTPDTRTAFLELNLLGDRITQISELLQRIFIQNESIALLFPKWILLILLITLYGFILSKKQPGIRSAIVLFLPLILISTICIIGPSILLKIWWSTPRVLSNVGFFWALIILLLVREMGQRSVLFAALGTVLFGFIYSNNRMMADQQRINFLDFQKSNRIIAQVEKIDRFQEKRILFLRQNEIMYTKGASTMYMDINISALYPAWSRLHMLQYASGYTLTSANAVDELQIKEKHKTIPSFPAQGSIFVDGDIIVIQL